MPNRILRDWTDSETIDDLSVYAERFFTRLIMKADDYGRYSGNLKLLKSTLFPLKTDIRETDISLWITECMTCGLIALYNVANKEYVQINNFKQVLRQKNEKYPPPDSNSTCVADDKQMTSRCHADASLKRNEVETEVEEKRSDDDIFFEFFRRAAGRHLSDDVLKKEIGMFKNKYPNVHINQAGALINSWVGRIGKTHQKEKTAHDFI